MSYQDRMLAACLTATRRVTGRPIVYHRDAAQAAFVAIKGRHIEEAVDGTTVIAEVEHTDWIFPLAELTCFEPPEPGKGDWIEDDAGRRYDVCEKTGRGWWQHQTPDKTWCRVTSTEIA